MTSPDPMSDSDPTDSDPTDSDPTDSAVGLPGESSGDSDVDAAVTRLGELDDLPTDQHVEVYEDIHRGLQGALAQVSAAGDENDHEPGSSASASGTGG